MALLQIYFKKTFSKCFRREKDTYMVSLLLQRNEDTQPCVHVPTMQVLKKIFSFEKKKLRKRLVRHCYWKAWGREVIDTQTKSVFIVLRSLSRPNEKIQNY